MLDKCCYSATWKYLQTVKSDCTPDGEQ